MAITTVIFGGLCFGAGVYAGMFLAENDYLHTKDLKALARELQNLTNIVSETFSGPVYDPPGKPRVVRNHDGKMVIEY